jgi:hypothetical protein
VLCTFCSSEAWAGPAFEVEVCQACARRIGALAKEADPEIWSVVAVSRSTPPDAPDAPDAQPSFTKMLRVFQRQVSERIASSDNESHYHLAHAYRAMGLFEDAVRAAGTALDVAPPAVPYAPALTLLLHEPLLKADGLERLRARLV